MDGDEFKLPENKLPFPVSPGDAPFKPFERWIDISRGPAKLEAVREIKSQAIRKLEILDEMHKDLIQRANRIIEQAKDDIRLHDIQVNAVKIRNQIYYLYEKDADPDSQFFSILEPAEYLRADPHVQYKGAYRLNEDSTWSEIENR